jgi:pseudouridine 5'-phosphatase
LIIEEKKSPMLKLLSPPHIAERESAVKLLSHFPGIALTLPDYLERRNIGQNARWPTVPLLPGAARLIAHLAKHNIPIAVATGSRRAAFTLKTGHLSDTYGLFGTHVLCGDDDIEGEEGLGNTRRVKGKPDPDIFLAAARTLLGRKVGWGDVDAPGVSDEERLERAKGLVFEDAIPGMQAGKRAGMSGKMGFQRSRRLLVGKVTLMHDNPVVWVPDTNLLDVEYIGTHKADQTIRSLLEFKPEEWGLPPYDD